MTVGIIIYLISSIINKKEDNNDFVYDIETIQGNFNTGFECIVKNTDSVFVKFKVEDDKGRKKHEKDAKGEMQTIRTIVGKGEG